MILIFFSSDFIFVNQPAHFYNVKCELVNIIFRSSWIFLKSKFLQFLACYFEVYKLIFWTFPLCKQIIETFSVLSLLLRKCLSSSYFYSQMRVSHQNGADVSLKGSPVLTESKKKLAHSVYICGAGRK